MIDKFYKQICPFCQKDHEQRLHINIICHCGAKYYFNRGSWLNRQTGEWKHGQAFEIYEKKVRFDNA
jgi:hypothetical protein